MAGAIFAAFDEPGSTYAPGITSCDMEVDYNTTLTYSDVCDPQNQEWKLTASRGQAGVAELHKFHYHQIGVVKIDTYTKNFTMNFGWTWHE